MKPKVELRSPGPGLKRSSLQSTDLLSFAHCKMLVMYMESKKLVRGITKNSTKLYIMFLKKRAV